MRKITVKFPPRARHQPMFTRTTSERNHGGYAVRDSVDSYSGPTVLDLKGYRRGGERHFQAIRLETSPTGSGVGSFRIDEVLSNGRTVTHGYCCSYPDFDACLRVAQRTQ